MSRPRTPRPGTAPPASSMNWGGTQVGVAGWVLWVWVCGCVVGGGGRGKEGRGVWGWEGLQRWGDRGGQVGVGRGRAQRGLGHEGREGGWGGSRKRTGWVVLQGCRIRLSSVSHSVPSLTSAPPTPHPLITHVTLTLFRLPLPPSLFPFPLPFPPPPFPLPLTLFPLPCPPCPPPLRSARPEPAQPHGRAAGAP